MFSLLAFVLAADPVFIVENRCPVAFIVTNKMPKAVPAVTAAVKTFPQFGYNASHNCPQCGRQQLRIAGYVGNGQHVHTCPNDGISWVH